MLYTYRGRYTDGSLAEGTLDVGSLDAAASTLAGRGIMATSIKPSPTTGTGSLSRAFPLGRRDKVRPEDVVMLTRQFFAINKAGLPLVQGMRSLAASNRSPQIQTALEEVGDRLEGGMQLSSAMERHPKVFNDLYVNMVAVGEESGRLEEVFEQLSHYLDNDLENRMRLKAALRTPSFILAAITAAVIIVTNFVIPTFSAMFAKFGADLPLPTRILIGVSDFFVAFWPYLLVTAVGGWFWLQHYITTPAGRLQWGQLKLRLPIAGDIVLRATMARYARAFSLMMRSGVPISQALRQCSEVLDNDYLGQKIDQIRTGVERGDSLLITHRRSGIFTPLVLQMIAVGEESGRIEDLLGEVADFYEREVDYDIKKLGDRLEPILIVIAGFFVLVLALGIFLPMWKLSTIAL